MDHPHDLSPEKFKVHRSFTTKQLSSPPAKWGPLTLSENSRVVRIYFTDSDATDSSTDDDEQEENTSRRKIKKKYITEIKIGTFAEKSSENRNGVVSKPKLKRPTKKNVKKIVPPNCHKYRGVRRRPSGKWAAEIRDSFDGCRIWLGVYDTPEEAEFVYNNAAIQIKGFKAPTKFSKIPVPENIPVPAMMVEVGCPLVNGVESSTSVIGDDWKPVEEIELKDGIWGLNDFDSCCLSSSSPLIYEEMMTMVEYRRCLNDEESFSFDFVEDLKSCSWNVEDFFDNPLKMV